MGPGDRSNARLSSHDLAVVCGDGVTTFADEGSPIVPESTSSPQGTARRVEMTLLTADGRLMHLPDDDPQLFRAARAGLGALGIVVEARLNVVPKFYLEETITVRPFDEVMQSIPALHESEPRPRFRWMPH